MLSVVHFVNEMFYNNIMQTFDEDDKDLKLSFCLRLLSFITGNASVFQGFLQSRLLVGGFQAEGLKF